MPTGASFALTADVTIRKWTVLGVLLLLIAVVALSIRPLARHLTPVAAVDGHYIRDHQTVFAEGFGLALKRHPREEDGNYKNVSISLVFFSRTDKPRPLAKETVESVRSDPWGHPWRIALFKTPTKQNEYEITVSAYSVGPDGVDQSGHGDDVWVRGKSGALGGIVLLAHEGGIAASSLCLWLAVVFVQLKRKSADRFVWEWVRVIGLASVPTIVVAAYAMGMPFFFGYRPDLPEFALLKVPESVAFTLSTGLMSFLALFMIRLRVLNNREARSDIGQPRLSPSTSAVMAANSL